MDPLAYSNGSYSTSDSGCRGDVFALAPRIYPVPDYLHTYEDLRTATRVAVDACALQNGAPCWIVRKQKPSCGQPACMECRGKDPLPTMPAAPNSLAEFSQEFRRTAVSNAARSVWQPVAAVTAQGIAPIAQGCVLPLWQRIFFNTGADHFTREKGGLTYQAAVAAAMYFAARQKKTRVVCAECPKTGRVIPMVYVDPGGVVRAAPAWDVGPTTVERMDRLEFDQYRAASRGASLMPHNF